MHIYQDAPTFSLETLKLRYLSNLRSLSFSACRRAARLAQEGFRVSQFPTSHVRSYLGTQNISPNELSSIATFHASRAH